jgi:hypothetical protein
MRKEEEMRATQAAFHQSEITLGGEAFLADPSGALYAPDYRALIVADLHFEKGSSFARKGQLLPPYDTKATLACLGAVIARFDPKLVIALGDSFHDNDGPNRLSAPEREMLAHLRAGRDWVWISGNHDPDLPAHVEGLRAEVWTLGAARLRHEPAPKQSGPEIFGHLHPVAVLGGRRRAFVTDGARLAMPAFGAYAGGLNLHHPALANLFSGRRVAHVLSNAQIFPVCVTRCARGA